MPRFPTSSRRRTLVVEPTGATLPDRAGARRRLDDATVYDRPDHGLRVAHDADPSLAALGAVTMRCRHAVIWGLTALYRHGLTTHWSPDVQVFLPRSIPRPRWKWPVCSFTSMRRPDLGVMLVRDPKPPVRITTPARTLVDCHMHPAAVEHEAWLGALRLALAERRVDPDEILRIGAELGAPDTLRAYVESAAG